MLQETLVHVVSVGEILTLSPDFVASYLRDLVVPVWIGLSDRLHEGKFAWSDGVSPILCTNWADKEPNNADGKVKNYCSVVDRYIIYNYSFFFFKIKLVDCTCRGDDSDI